MVCMNNYSEGKLSLPLLCWDNSLPFMFTLVQFLCNCSKKSIPRVSFICHFPAVEFGATRYALVVKRFILLLSRRLRRRLGHLLVCRFVNIIYLNVTLLPPAANVTSSSHKCCNYPPPRQFFSSSFL